MYSKESYLRKDSSFHQLDYRDQHLQLGSDVDAALIF